MSVLWKNFSLEGGSGETHREAPQGSDKALKADSKVKIKIKIKFQDGEGEGMNSREGISVSHYPEHFKEEVVAFAKATSQKDAKDRLSTFYISIIVT